MRGLKWRKMAQIGVCNRTRAIGTGRWFYAGKCHGDGTCLLVSVIYRELHIPSQKISTHPFRTSVVYTNMDSNEIAFQFIDSPFSAEKKAPKCKLIDSYGMRLHYSQEQIYTMQQQQNAAQAEDISNVLRPTVPLLEFARKIARLLPLRDFNETNIEHGFEEAWIASNTYLALAMMRSKLPQVLDEQQSKANSLKERILAVDNQNGNGTVSDGTLNVIAVIALAEV